MPRPTMTRADRARNVSTAASDIGALIERAKNIEAQNGPTDSAALRAWEAVEVAGATIHRQSRLLAGKSRGG